jgi:hypothetical protein
MPTQSAPSSSALAFNAARRTLGLSLPGEAAHMMLLEQVMAEAGVVPRLALPLAASALKSLRILHAEPWQAARRAAAGFEAGAARATDPVPGGAGRLGLAAVLPVLETHAGEHPPGCRGVAAAPRAKLATG